MEECKGKQELVQEQGHIKRIIDANNKISSNAEETIGNILDTIRTLMGNEIVESNTPTFVPLPSKIECSLDELYIIQARLENIYSKLKQIDLLLKLL